MNIEALSRALPLGWHDRHNPSPADLQIPYDLYEITDFADHQVILADRITGSGTRPIFDTRGRPNLTEVM